MIFGEGPIIKNIAGDLNKLFLQGSRVGQPITNVEGDAAADQGTADLLAAMDPVIQEVAVGMSGEESRHYTVSGTPPLTITDSLGNPLTSWSVDLLPYQEGAGDPSPSNVRPIHGTDKVNIVTASDNLLPFDFIQGSALSLGQLARVVSRILIPIIANNTYTFSASDYTNYQYVLNSGENNRLPFPSTPSSAYSWCGTSVNWEQHDITFTATRNGYLVVVVKKPDGTAISPSDISGVKMKFEMSASSTDWTPNAVSTVITLPSTVYTATIGSCGGESSTAVIDLGTLDWNYRESNNTFWVLLPNTQIYDANTLPPMLCEAYPTGLTKGYTSTAINDKTIIMATGRRYVLIKDTDYTDVDLFKTSLNGVHLVYELETPTQFTVSAPSIPTPQGDATTWALAEDGTVDSMKVTYVGKA